jgi:hypothetical protein
MAAVHEQCCFSKRRFKHFSAKKKNVFKTFFLDLNFSNVGKLESIIYEALFQREFIQQTNTEKR